MAFVYLLRCGDTSLYCGWTFDVERRLAAHRSGRGARYTRSRLPLELAGVLAQPDAASARREEARIKRLPRREKLALIARGGEALPYPSERAVGRARGPAVTPSE